jgi:membrane-associated phospholipid phosphatase
MDSLVVATAQYLPLGIPLAAGVVWLFLPRRDKFGLAVKTIASLVFVVVLIKLGAAIYTDPRPFVVDPSVKPLFAHAADNGFPSDHTTVAATVALLVMTYRRRLGAVLLALSILAGAARVAAHVHHVQDIIAGLLIAAVAVGVAASTWAWAEPRLRARNVDPASR